MLKLSFLSMVYQRYSLERAFHDADRMGFNGIEVWGARPHAYVYDCDDRLINQINQWKETYNLEIAAYTPENCVYPYSLCSQSEKERIDTIEYYKEALNIAAQIGAPLIQITPGDPGYEGNEADDWKHLCETLAPVCEYAEKVGVDVVMETLTPMESLILTRADDLARLIKDVPSPRLLGMLDMVNPVFMKESFENYFDRLGEKMGHIHVTDSDGTTYAHLPIGEGIIAFEPAIQLFERRGYQRYCSIELSGCIEDPENYMQLSINRLRKIMENAGVKQTSRN